MSDELSIAERLEALEKIVLEHGEFLRHLAKVQAIEAIKAGVGADNIEVKMIYDQAQAICARWDKEAQESEIELKKFFRPHEKK